MIKITLPHEFVSLRLPRTIVAGHVLGLNMVNKISQNLRGIILVTIIIVLCSNNVPDEFCVLLLSSIPMGL